MWASDSSNASDIAEQAGEDEMFMIIADKIHLCSPVASGRLAMAVYHKVFEATADLAAALDFTEWWSNDGGNLESVPDGTPPAA